MQINEIAATIALRIGIAIDLLILAAATFAILQKKRESLTLWGKWTLLVLLGFAPGLYLGTTIISDLNETLGLLFIGFALGFAEWFVIRHYLNNAGHWILATIIGWASGVSLTQFESHSLVYFSGVFLGVTQFLVIGKRYGRSVWWIVANILGVAYFVFQVDVMFSLSSNFDWRFFGFVGLSTLMYGAVTGITLLWFVRKDDHGPKLPNDVIKSSPSYQGSAPQKAS